MNAIEALKAAKENRGIRVRPKVSNLFCGVPATFYFNMQHDEFRRIYRGFEASVRVIPVKFVLAEWEIVVNETSR